MSQPAVNGATVTSYLSCLDSKSEHILRSKPAVLPDALERVQRLPGKRTSRILEHAAAERVLEGTSGVPSLPSCYG